ncbi:hypothetical protein M3J09_009889 [Ascochyta lentis]
MNMTPVELHNAIFRASCGQSAGASVDRGSWLMLRPSPVFCSSARCGCCCCCCCCHPNETAAVFSQRLFARLHRPCPVQGPSLSLSTLHSPSALSAQR